MSDQQVTEAAKPCITDAAKSLGTLRTIDPICEALSLGSQLLESMQQIANTLDSICEAQNSHIQATDEVVEAVRALKPETPKPMLLVEKDNPSALFWQLKDTIDLRNQALAEIDRMNRVIADQALTIGTLKDAGADALTRLNRCHDDADKYQVRALDAEAELKRFREREKLVEKVIHMAEVIQYDRSELAELTEAVAAVRAFKVTT